VTIHVGTSGWQYADWRGALYQPGLPQREWLRRYAEVFDTVELNNSFYRLPERETFARWREQTPAGFVVAVKASRFITHLRRLRDAKDPVDLLWERAGGLGSRLGPVLFQLPPRFPADVERLRAFLGWLQRSTRAAFEFRDDSWLRPEVFELLDRAGCALVWPDRPGSRAHLPVTGGWAYVRFHQGRRDAPGYARDKLRRWADRIATLDVADVYLYFNNDTGGAAVRDALALRSLLDERATGGAPAPPRRPGRSRSS
jgi:uncharacterized protein YecE (DUF72 family)